MSRFTNKPERNYELFNVGAQQLGPMLLLLFFFFHFVCLFCRHGHGKSCHKSCYSTGHYLSWFTWKWPQLEREVVYFHLMAAKSYSAGKLNKRLSRLKRFTTKCITGWKRVHWTCIRLFSQECRTVYTHLLAWIFLAPVIEKLETSKSQSQCSNCCKFNRDLPTWGILILWELSGASLRLNLKQNLKGD